LGLWGMRIRLNSALERTGIARCDAARKIAAS